MPAVVEMIAEAVGTDGDIGVQDDTVADAAAVTDDDGGV